MRTVDTVLSRVMKRFVCATCLACGLAILWTPFARAQSGEAVFEIRDYSVSGASLVTQDELMAAARVHIGTAKSFADIEKARAAVQAIYIDKGYGAVQVVVPEQEVSSGLVQLRVIEARISSVEVSGNEHFDSDNVRATLPQLTEGTSPNTRSLSRSLALANENPARQSVVRLGAGPKAGEIVARVAVKDEKPWRVNMAVDNSGNDQTGRSRASVTYRHANLFNRDHQFVAQYTTSPEHTGDVSITGLAYRIPFFELGDSMQVMYIRSNVSAGSVAGFDLNGRGTSMGLRYFRTLDAQGAYSHFLTFGAERRDYRSDLRAPGFGVLKTDLTVRPLSIGYTGKWKTQVNQAGFNLTVVRNLSGGTDGSGRDFEANRSGAEPDYTIVRMGGWWRHVFDNEWSALLSVNGQATADVLVPVEYFGLGGTESVRGFYEREIGADSGGRAGFELFGPDLAPRLGMAKSSLRLSWFVDAGGLRRKRALPGELRSVSLASTGFGVHYNYTRTGSVRLDWARVLKGDNLRRDGSHRVHASMVWSF